MPFYCLLRWQRDLEPKRSRFQDLHPATSPEFKPSLTLCKQPSVLPFASWDFLLCFGLAISNICFPLFRWHACTLTELILLLDVRACPLYFQMQSTDITDKSNNDCLILGHVALFSLSIYVIKSCFVYCQSRPVQSKKTWVILLISRTTANLTPITQR